MTTRALIYTRISRDADGDAASNERQERACRALCEARGWEVVATTRDVSVSAYSGKERVGWEQAKQQARDGKCDVIVAWHLDRITRSMVELEQLIDLGVGVATATGDIDLTSDVGRMVARILAAVARAEVERKGARQRLANAQRADAGKPWRSGFAPFGYQEDFVTPEPIEADAIRKAVSDVLMGKTIRQVSRDWNDLGLKPRHARSTVWESSAVTRVLKNPRYAGIATYLGGEVGVGEWEPIITKEDHQKLVAYLSDQARRFGVKNRMGNTPKNLLTGLGTCGACGSTLRATSANGEGKYRCSGSGACVSINREDADAYVLAALVSHMQRMKVKPKAKPTEGLVELRAELDDLIARQSAIARMIALGDIAPAEGEDLALSLRSRVRAIEERLSDTVGVDLTDMLETPEKAAETVLAWPLEKRRIAVSVLDVVVNTTGRQGRRRVPANERMTVNPKK